MSLELQSLLVFGIIIYYFLIIRLLKKGTLLLKYSLLWMFFGAILFVIAIFPNLMDCIAKAIGVVSPVNALFFLMLVFIIILLMAVTAIVSKQTERIKGLTQYVAILEKRIRELENKKDTF